MAIFSPNFSHAGKTVLEETDIGSDIALCNFYGNVPGVYSILLHTGLHERNEVRILKLEP